MTNWFNFNNEEEKSPSKKLICFSLSCSFACESEEEMEKHEAEKHEQDDNWV